MILSSLLVKLGLDAKNFEQGLAKANTQLNKALTNANRSVSGFNRLGGTLANVGKSLTVGLTVPLAGAGAAALKFATDFNESMANVATLIPGNTQRVQELKSAVQDMAVDVGKRTGELAAGLYQVVSAFGDSADSAQILQTAAVASAAGLSTTTDAVNLLSAVMKGYGDTSAEAAQQASDLAFQTVRLGQTTFPELSAAIGRVVPIAAKLHVSQQELFAGFATLTGVTGDTAEVSTQLAAVLRAMMKPTTDMSKAVAQLGYDSAETMVQQLGMQKALTALIGTTDGTVESVGKLFGRAEALNAVFALTGNQADTFNSKLAAMNDAAGATQAAFEEQTNGINKAGFTMKQVAAKVEVLAQKFGDALAPALSDALDALRPLLDHLGDLANWFAELSPTTQKAIVGIGAFAAALGPLTLAGGKAIQMFAGLRVAVATLPAVLATTKLAV